MGVYSALLTKGTSYRQYNGKLSPIVYAGDQLGKPMTVDVLLLGYKLDHTINNTCAFLTKLPITTAKAAQEQLLFNS